MQYNTHRANQWKGSDTSSQYGDHFCLVIVKSDLKNKLWAGHVFASMSWCDLDLQCSDQNVAWDMSFLFNSCKIRLQITKLLATHDLAARSFCDLNLKCSDPNLACDTSAHYGDQILWNSFKIRLQRTKLWAGHDFAARSCCDLDLQCSDQNVARNTSSQYGDHFCEIFLKSEFK